MGRVLLENKMKIFLEMILGSQNYLVNFNVKKYSWYQLRFEYIYFHLSFIIT